ncbi:serine hydrolase [Thalassococcus sp. S3]|uniref:serine hydrolase n=1 Tax=Thalassococcus sp. S3 TaxID=2017482 RepID=UPI0010248F63|nr:serine hydrolase [Thalassococcus sp. S3]QBF32321.1 hypothetical protein CFI11_14010 [Thalassococcus sp. S3]
MTDKDKSDDAQEHATRRYEARIGLYKVIFGTFAIGALGVIVPGAIDWWSFTAEQQRVEFQDKRAADEIQQSFVAEYFNTAISEDVELRIRFAEYFSQVAPDGTRDQWQSYLSVLVDNRDRVRGEIDSFEREIRALLDKEADGLDLPEQTRKAEIERRLEWLYREIGYVERGRSVVPSKAENLSGIKDFTLEDNGFPPNVRYFIWDPDSDEAVGANLGTEPTPPGSMVKLMTLYLAFEAIRDRGFTFDDEVLISSNAANEPPSKLGLRQGQSIKLRYLIRAAAIKSANDAATAIAEHIGGSEAEFVLQMNSAARRLGMTNTTFKNAHGLTEIEMLSTARDLAILMERHYYDFPEYFNLFSRLTSDAGIREVCHTGRRHLESDSRVKGIVTSYTRASGFGATMLVEQDGLVRIVVIIKARSTAERVKLSRKLTDLAFE